MSQRPPLEVVEIGGFTAIFRDEERVSGPDRPAHALGEELPGAREIPAGVGDDPEESDEHAPITVSDRRLEARMCCVEVAILQGDEAAGVVASGPDLCLAASQALGEQRLGPIPSADRCERLG